MAGEIDIRPAALGRDFLRCATVVTRAGAASSQDRPHEAEAIVCVRASHEPLMWALAGGRAARASELAAALPGYPGGSPAGDVLGRSSAPSDPGRRGPDGFALEGICRVPTTPGQRAQPLSFVNGRAVATSLLSACVPPMRTICRRPPSAWLFVTLDPTSRRQRPIGQDEVPVSRPGWCDHEVGACGGASARGRTRRIDGRRGTISAFRRLAALQPVDWRILRRDPRIPRQGAGIPGDLRSRQVAQAVDNDILQSADNTPRRPASQAGAQAGVRCGAAVAIHAPPRSTIRRDRSPPVRARPGARDLYRGQTRDGVDRSTSMRPTKPRQETAGPEAPPRVCFPARRRRRHHAPRAGRRAARAFPIDPRSEAASRCWRAPRNSTRRTAT